MSSPLIRKVFDLQLGSRFRYLDPANPQVYVLLDRGGCGLIGHAPDDDAQKWRQGMYSVAESPEEFREMLVEFVPVIMAEGAFKLGAQHIPPTHTPVKAMPTADVIKGLLLTLSEDERLEVFTEFCRGCGKHLPGRARCHCMNDE